MQLGRIGSQSYYDCHNPLLVQCLSIGGRAALAESEICSCKAALNITSRPGAAVFRARLVDLKL